MRIIGIDINSAKVVFFTIEVLADGSVQELAPEVKSIAIADDHNNTEIRDFQQKVFLLLCLRRL